MNHYFFLTTLGKNYTNEISVYHYKIGYCFKICIWNVVSLNPAHGEVYSIQHYVMQFVSDLRQVGGFLRVL